MEINDNMIPEIIDGENIEIVINSFQELDKTRSLQEYCKPF